SSPAAVAHGVQQSRKSYDRTSLGNAFIWTRDTNGEKGHLNSSSEFAVKSGSVHSLHTARSGVSSSYSPPAGSNGRDGSHSRTGSSLSSEGLSLRDRHVHKENGWVMSDDESPKQSHLHEQQNHSQFGRRENTHTNGVVVAE